MCHFTLALQGVTVVSFPRVLQFALAFSTALLPGFSHSHSRSLRSLVLCTSHLHVELLYSLRLCSRILLASLTHIALWRSQKLKKTCVSIDSNLMSLPGSQGVPMPSFMPIGPKLWTLEGYTQKDGRPEIQTVMC